MSYWILKTEPSSYSFDQLKKDKKTVWDGVRNYQARNNLRAMKKGDTCFIYHSVGPKEIVGTATVVKEAYPDPTTNDDRWSAVDLSFESALSSPVTLEHLKHDAQLSGISLVKQSRLSVCPITKKEADRILALSKIS